MATSDKAVEKLQLEIKQTLEATELCDVRAVQSRKGDLRFLFTVRNEAEWLRLLSKFLALSSTAEWYVFVGKKYVLHEGRLMAPWVMIIDSGESGTLRAVVPQVRTCLTSAYEALYGSEAEPAVVEMAVPFALPKGMVSRVTTIKAGSGQSMGNG